MGNSSSFLGTPVGIIDEFGVNFFNDYVGNYSIRSHYKLWSTHTQTEYGFGDTLVFNSSGYIYLTHHIVFPEDIARGTPFNVSVSLNSLLSDRSYPTQYAIDSVTMYRTTYGSTINVKDYFAITSNNGDDWSVSSIDSLVFEDTEISSMYINYRVYGSTSGLTSYVTSVNISEASETSLLNGIIGWLKNVYDSIVELPGKIANLIIDGVKDLFIPSESDITEVKESWDTLLEDRFGGLYQTIDLIDDYASSFTERSQTSITVPVLTVPLAGVDFVLGGWEVQIVPDKFDFLIDILKTIISIVATILFVNGLKGRLEKLIGGSTNI